jgi:hypothetical protein
VSDHLELQLGARPWQPTESTQLVTELDFYDMPTAGVLEQGVSPVLFLCVDGHGTHATVWVYAPLQPAEAQALATMQGREAIDAEMRRIFRSKPVVVALAVDGQLRLATSGELRLQGAVLREAALKAVTDQVESDRQAACSLLPA